MKLTAEDIQKIVNDTVKGVMGEHLEGMKQRQDEYLKLFQDSRIDAVAEAAKARKTGKGMHLTQYVMALAATKGIMSEAARYAKKNYGEGSEVTKALAAGDFAAGGAIVPPDFVEDIIELLVSATVIRQMNPVTAPMPNGSLTLPKLTGGATASYIGENDDIPESQQTFGDVKLVFRKLVSLVPISNDLIRFSSPAGDAIVRDDIISSLGRKADITFIRADGTVDQPKGLLFWALPASKIAANGTVNLANITTDLGKLVLALEDADVRMIRPGWLFAPRTKQFLMTIRDGNGNFAYRDEMLAGTLWGFPFGTTTAIPTNLGGGSDESEIYFVDFADAIIGEAQTLTVDASTEASYKSGGNLVSAFSKDQTVIRAIEEHDFAMRHDASVAVLTAVKWIP